MLETDNGWSDEDIYEMADVNETTRLMSSDHCGQSHTMSFKSAEADSERFAINKGYISGQDETSSEKDAIPSLPETNSDDDRGRATKQQQTTAYVWLLGYLSDAFGRKVCTILASLVFTAGALVLGLAENVTMLIIGRLIIGIGIGVASMTVPVYIAEVAPSHIRGRLVTVNTLFITGGQFIASLLDGGFSYMKSDGWRYMLGLAGLPSLIQLIGFLFLPESPRWMMKKGNESRAREILVAVRGTKDVEEEMADMRESCEEDKRETNNSSYPTIVLMLKSPRMRRALIVGCGLQFFQQVSGINTVMYYSASIIKMAGVNNQHLAIWLAAMTAGINFVFTLVGVWLVERIGRKRLLLCSLAGVILSLALLAVGFQISAFNSPHIVINENISSNNHCVSYSTCELCIEDKSCGFCFVDVNGEANNGSCLSVSNDNEAYSQYGRCAANASLTDVGLVWAKDYCPTAYSWLPIFGLAMYLMFFAPGMGPMPWTINAEIYPLWARSTGSSMSAATNWLSNLVVSMTFLTLTETITKYGTYWLYVGVASVGFLFFLCLLPETKGCKLEEVEELFAESWCHSCCSDNGQEAKLQIKQKSSSTHL
ncbi:hypothetical protein C0Q70_15164 [Pomacea canaliculata]|uniref:Major facilitator superfamily (MFS) profile domain-containing protein n=1 Tax=Pomacea canaliculata TaxID=400727 RepID=A0A2T7NU25_POMCA|nr:hypothetical protein C0Q70_15164 [Pomacea canaliculata]